MGSNISNMESKAKICGIVILLGAAVCSIPLFTIVRYAFKAESPYSFNFLIATLACIAGFIIIGVGVFTYKHHLFRVGLFTVAVAFVLDTYFPLMWIKSNADYYDSLSKGFGDGYLFLLLYCLAALAGFLLMGILFSQKPEGQLPKVGSIAMICLAIYIVLSLGYSIYFMKDSYLKLWEYLTGYITGSFMFPIVGAIGVMLMPVAFSDEIPEVEILKSLNANQNIPQVNQKVVSETISTNTTETAGSGVFEEDTITLLREYKQLLDMEIITEEEFRLKKSELLK